MIIGGDKSQVIDNIKQNADHQLFNDKVEVADPTLSVEEEDQLIHSFLAHRSTLSYHVKNWLARFSMRALTDIVNSNTIIEPASKISELPQGGIITCNHFNPLDNTAIRKLVAKKHRRLFVVSQPTNLKMTGLLGFFMNYDDIIPLSKSFRYLKATFPRLLQETFQKGNYVLIYPEQEMWFNYRLPRPPKRGAYYFAAKLNVPIISCFVEIQDLAQDDNQQFKKVRYVVHVLPTIYPDPDQNIEHNTNMMMAKDYAQKSAAYEKSYHQKLDYEFSPSDIAGWQGN
ncbi:lysophospholipid acyltransferase family protein [Xylocopilactobacillus apicola]|uniref:1-acyl-sn-glycerol-3-phosphate acyltransferase n=1 Tax=Xylocopilactobacillus apicola TaxID=2932184 RepID=A0AAU9DYN4_9LACO|nr:lysophospholipid acyltransferase family protein [Xylocopilactobacillus apicola]BDR59313.1 1-acyl-sn-glycerol-3-phosphate acyltransferase [Xylocopilactobacillus apicola]